MLRQEVNPCAARGFATDSEQQVAFAELKIDVRAELIARVEYARFRVRGAILSRLPAGPGRQSEGDFGFGEPEAIDRNREERLRGSRRDHEQRIVDFGFGEADESNLDVGARVAEAGHERVHRVEPLHCDVEVQRDVEHAQESRDGEAVFGRELDGRAEARLEVPRGAGDREGERVDIEEDGIFDVA
jgi:hypothetical protein